VAETWWRPRFREFRVSSSRLKTSPQLEAQQRVASRRGVFA
jgi:hypothetical protein